MAEQVKQRACLIVIDGWGVSDVKDGNGVSHIFPPLFRLVFPKSSLAYTIPSI